MTKADGGPDVAYEPLTSDLESKKKSFLVEEEDERSWQREENIKARVRNSEGMKQTSFIKESLFGNKKIILIIGTNFY